MKKTFICLGLIFFEANVFSQTIPTVVREYYVGVSAQRGAIKSEIVNGVKTEYYYYDDGTLKSITHPSGAVTVYSSYVRGIATKEVHASGTSSEVSIYREVDGNGCITSETDGEGNKKIYGRDILCRMTSMAPPLAGSATTTIRYDAATASTPETHTLTRGNYTEISKFDGFGRLVEKTAGGVKQVWRYDLLGRKEFASYPAYERESSPPGDAFTYDIFDRLVRVTHSDGTFATYAYGKNADGRPQVVMTNERGNAITNVFQAFGSPDSAELMSILTSEPANSSPNVEMKRNVFGQVTSVTQGGFTRLYGYDSRFYLTSTVNPETGTVTMERNNSGDLTSLKNSFGGASTGITYFDINPLGQVTGIRYPDSSASVVQNWGKNGKLIYAKNAASIREWKYNANGNLIRESIDIGGQNFSTSYNYNENDQLSQIFYPKKGSILDMKPDVLGRPTKIGNFISGIDYSMSGELYFLRYGNGVVTEFKNDSRRRPTYIWAGTAREFSDRYNISSPNFMSQGSVVDLSMNYDGAGNLVSMHDSKSSIGGRSFGYDSVERLNMVIPAGGVGSSLTYDGVGNIKSQAYGGLLTYQYNAQSNRLMSTVGVKNGSYTYDVRGNITSNGAVTFQYDDNSRLKCAQCGQPNEIGYAYDALGMRVSRTKGGQTNYLVYASNGDLLMELNPSTNQRQEHIYLKGQKIATLTDSGFFATSINLKISSSSITPGQSVKLTAAVTGGRTPEGKINFYDNGVLIGSAVMVSGTAVLNTSALGFGFHDFTAVYVGDGTSASSATAGLSRVESGNVSATIMGIITNFLLDE